MGSTAGLCTGFARDGRGTRVLRAPGLCEQSRLLQEIHGSSAMIPASRTAKFDLLVFICACAEPAVATGPDHSHLHPFLCGERLRNEDVPQRQEYRIGNVSGIPDNEERKRVTSK